MRIYKIKSGQPTVTYAEALDQALCYGWIDGQKRPHDDQSWLQKFTPRRARSGWSKRNTLHVERLMQVLVGYPNKVLFWHADWLIVSQCTVPTHQKISLLPLNGH